MNGDLMTNLILGDKVTVNDSGPTEYTIVHVKPQPGADGFLYLCETSDGTRIARYSHQLTKVE